MALRQTQPSSIYLHEIYREGCFFFFFSLLSINNVKNCFSNAFQQKYEKTVLYVRVLSSNMTIKKHHPFSVWCIFKFEVFLTNYYLIYRKILGKCLFLRQKINIKFGYVLLPVKSLIILMHCYTYMIYVQNKEFLIS